MPRPIKGQSAAVPVCRIGFSEVIADCWDIGTVRGASLARHAWQPSGDTPPFFQAEGTGLHQPKTRGSSRPYMVYRDESVRPVSVFTVPRVGWSQKLSLVSARKSDPLVLVTPDVAIHVVMAE